jgi:hypothetical protein
MNDLAARLDRLSIPEPNTGCLLFLGTIDRYGYGGIWINGKKEKAHRAAWKVATGKWPPSNLVLDHRCRVRACLNVDHLKPKTMANNTRCGESFAGKNSRKTHCPKGHEYAGVNLYVENGRRKCRQCRTARRKE